MGCVYIAFYYRKGYLYGGGERNEVGKKLFKLLEKAKLLECSEPFLSSFAVHFMFPCSLTNFTLISV